MRTITYQHKKVVDALIQKGEYKITKPSQTKTLNKFRDSFGVSSFQKTYDYIFDRMKKKIKNKSDFDDDIIAPIWGWHKVFSKKRINHDNKGLYRITLEIDEKKVLLSDFVYYENFAVGGLDFWYYPNKELVKAMYEREKIEGPEVIYKEFDRMINKQHLKFCDYIQATFFKIRLCDVVSIEKVLRKDWEGYDGYWDIDKTTLCYLKKDDCYLLLYRNKKENDMNEGKWLGVGGHLKKGETPDQAAIREIREETGLKVHSLKCAGEVLFVNDDYQEEMYLYEIEDFSGELIECNEGQLKWVPIKDLDQYPMWEGDKAFLPLLINHAPYFYLKITYSQSQLVKIENWKK